MSLVSQRKMEANRNNAGKSTGPKDTSLTKFNALKHGMKAVHAIVPGEDPEMFEEMKDAAYKRFNPQDIIEASIVDDFVRALWKRLRAEGVEQAILSKLRDQDGKIRWQEILDRDYLEKIIRYGDYASNKMVRALDSLTSLKKFKYADQEGEDGAK